MVADVTDSSEPQHQEVAAAEHDARRTDWLASQGFRALPFRNHELDDGAWLAAEEIRKALDEAGSTSPHNPLPNPPHKGEGVGGN
jgi:very-short-patch-repair endonuclease